MNEQKYLTSQTRLEELNAGLLFCVKNNTEVDPKDVEERNSIIKSVQDQSAEAQEYMKNTITERIKKIIPPQKLVEVAMDYIDTVLSDTNACIGGSLGLYIHGFDLQREIRDIDIVCSVLKNFINNWQKIEMPNNVAANCWQTHVYIFGIKLNVHIIEWTQPFKQTVLDGVRVVDLSDIVVAKAQFAKSGTAKHIDDFVLMIEQLNMEKKTYFK